MSCESSISNFGTPINTYFVNLVAGDINENDTDEENTDNSSDDGDQW